MSKLLAKKATFVVSRWYICKQAVVFMNDKKNPFLDVEDMVREILGRKGEKEKNSSPPPLLNFAIFFATPRANADLAGKSLNLLSSPLEQFSGRHAISRK